LRTSHGYGFTVFDNGVPAVEFSRVETTFWGVPADPSHDALRGLICQKITFHTVGLECGERVSGEHSDVPAVPFLIMPSACSSGPLTATIRADSWEQPGSVSVNGQYRGYVQQAAESPLPTVLDEGQGEQGFTGCDLLQFQPSLEVRPDRLLADEPAGVSFDVSVPQRLQPGTTTTPQLRDAAVTLPLGMSISPGVVDGVQACDATGPEGVNIVGPESEQIGSNGEWQLAPSHCPKASIVGEAEAITPLLPEPVKGHVYLAKPRCGGSGQAACTEKDALNGNLYKLYLELGGEGALANTGIEIKVEGKTEVNPASGQITTKFLENPQAPFSELKIRLKGGDRAPLANPPVCGPVVTTSDFRPWSAPGKTPQGGFVAGTPDATPTSEFSVNGCIGQPALAPGFAAGTITATAGQFSPFTLVLTRNDREQYLAGVQVHTPPGLLGVLASVPLCGEPQASQGLCPEASKIGTTRVASGAGAHPFEIGGVVYLTGPYCVAKGSCTPFGLSVVTHAVAGPFNLGLIVVRAQIAVDPHNSTLAVTSDPLPQIIFGVPLRLQRITVMIDRHEFMFNPTNCKAQSISATISGSGQAFASVLSPFAAGGCRNLAFKPAFKVATSAHTSRLNGASLDAKLSFPKDAFGHDANVVSVKVRLPKQLPSRLTTLQKACPARMFDANPAACPKASVVGVARALTPLLPIQPAMDACPSGKRCPAEPASSVIGPVYFVSHGGDAFPQLIIVLQGDGVRVDLAGDTFIDKHGITSSTFKTVPDVPVTAFELYLPQGPFSALAANGNLCKPKTGLTMPTQFVAQNGAVFKQNTKIAVTGCHGATGRIARHTFVNGRAH
jgi:hypothetical protein